MFLRQVRVISRIDLASTPCTRLFRGNAMTLHTLDLPAALAHNTVEEERQRSAEIIRTAAHVHNIELGSTTGTLGHPGTKTQQ